MDAVLIIASCIVTAYAVARVQRQRGFTSADLLVGVFAGFASAMMARRAALDEISLPIFFGCALTLGLASFRRRSLWR